MAFCIPKFQVEALKQKFKSGELNPTELSKLTSAERRAAFAKITGETVAKEINALFESKLLLKNQQLGMINWASKILGLSKEVKRDILSKIEKLQNVLEPKELDAFLNDLVAQRLGVEVTVEEAGRLVNFIKNIDEARAKIPEGSPIGSKERIEYGLQTALLKQYLESLKVKAENPGLRRYLDNPKLIIQDLAGITKSALSSLDNSFQLRQGWVALTSHPSIWIKQFLLSWKSIAKELKGQDAILPIRADIYSRPNALNGNYAKAKLAIGIATEEAFPTSIQGRIPILGRLFNASEAAYNGSALRLRADLFDKFYKIAESQGVNLSDPFELQSIGKLVNSMTGRGSLGKAEAISGELNTALFSPRYIKANYDVLSAHLTDKNVSSFAKKQAALNLVKTVGTTAAVLYIANQLWPGSVTHDPRSSDFGKVKIGNQRYVIGGGMPGIITLASRLSTGSTVNSKGKVENLFDPKYGGKNAMDVLYQFLENKAAPIPRTFIDVMKGRMFSGEKPTVGKELQQLLTPLPIQSYLNLKEEEASNILASMILEGLGIGISVYSNR